MQGSWKRTVKPAGDVDDLTTVVGWLAPSVVRWPAVTLQWLVSDSPEPSWLQLLSSGDGKAPNRATPADAAIVEAIGTLDADAIRSWRAEIRQRVDSHRTDDSWIETAPMGQDSVSLQVHSTEIAGRWSGFTIADFTTGVEAEGETARERWIRFEPEGPTPVRAWLVVTNGGMVVRLAENSSGALLVDTARRTADRGTVTRGDFVVDTDPACVRISMQDVILEQAVIRRLRLSLTPKSRARIRLVATGSVQVGRFNFGWLSPFWPLLRPFVSKRIALAAADNIDRVMSSGLWSAAAQAAKAESRPPNQR